MKFGRYKGKRYAGKEIKKEKDKEIEKYKISEEIPKALAEDYKPKQKKKSKGKKILKISIIVLVILLILIIVSVGVFIALKLGKINYKDLDESDLAINDNLYSEVEGLTQSEYDKVTNILFLGSDSRDMDDAYAGSGDANIIISINPKFKSIKLISIPRDTAVYIDDTNKRYKISVAFNVGQEQLTVKTINKTFDLNLKEYVTVNISEMYNIINELGGLELDITKDEMKYINEYIDMFYGYSGRPVQKVTTYGKVTLTGEQVAAHVKERMAGSSDKSETHGDYGRTKRQREVLQALLNKIASRDAGEISRISDLILEQVTTNVDTGKIASLLLEFILNKDAYMKNVTSVMLPGLDYSDETIENNAYIYVTNDIERAKKEFIHYMYEI